MQARTPHRVVNEEAPKTEQNTGPLPKRELPKPWEPPPGSVHIAPSQSPAPQYAAAKPGEPIYPESGPNKSTLKKKD